MSNCIITFPKIYEYIRSITITSMTLFVFAIRMKKGESERKTGYVVKDSGEEVIAYTTFNPINYIEGESESEEIAEAENEVPEE